MTKRSAFTAEILQDGHLSIPDQTMKALALRKGCKVRATLMAESFDREQFLQLFGISSVCPFIICDPVLPHSLG